MDAIIAMKTQIFTSRDLSLYSIYSMTFSLVPGVSHVHRPHSSSVFFSPFFLLIYFYFFIYGWIGCLAFASAVKLVSKKNVNVHCPINVNNFSLFSIFHFTVLQISKVNRKFCENLKRKLIQQ